MKTNIDKQPVIDYLLASTLIALPFSIKATNYIIIILVLMLSLLVFNRIATFKKDYALSLIINIMPFLFMLFSLTFGTDLIRGLHAIEKYLPLLIFPFVFAFGASEKPLDFFVKIFSFTILSMCVISFLYGIYQLVFMPLNEQPLLGDMYNRVPSKWNALSNTNLMRPFNINPIYMSLYVSLSIFSILFVVGLKKAIRISAISFLILFQLLIGSRIGLLALSIALVILPFKLKGNRLKVTYLFSVLFIASFSVIFVLTNPILLKRHVKDFTSISIPPDVSGWNALNIRVAIWKCSIKSFVDSPLYGYGVASQSQKRELCYRDFSFYGPFGTDLDSHNQYLEYMLIGGLTLLALFMIQCGYSLKKFLSDNLVIPLLFLVLFAVTCMGESLLETHKGIVFFSFFNSLFLSHSKKGT